MQTWALIVTAEGKDKAECVEMVDCYIRAAVETGSSVSGFMHKLEANSETKEAFVLAGVKTASRKS